MLPLERIFSFNYNNGFDYNAKIKVRLFGTKHIFLKKIVLKLINDVECDLESKLMN